MKNLLLTLATIVSSLLLASCDNSNGEPPTVICPGFNPFEATYATDGTGCCTLSGVGIFSDDEVKQMIVGYGWKTIATYRVMQDGRLATTDFYNGMTGIAPTDLWFTSDSKAVRFYNNTGLGDKYHSTRYAYDTSRGFLLLDIDDTALSDADRYMQIVNFNDLGDEKQLYTMQKVACTTTKSDKTEPVYALVVYQRMTDEELKKAKENAKYDADKESNGAVPESCKFRVAASYWDADDEETSGAVIMAFRKVKFQLTDNLGTTMLPNPALDYFDSIVWRSNSSTLPCQYLIHKRGSGSEQTKLQWSTCFLDQNPDMVSEFNGYKDGRIAYTYEMRHDIYADKFLCYDWSRISTSKPREYTAACLLDPSRSFTVYEPRTFGGTDGAGYAELRYNSEAKGKGNDTYILEKEAYELTSLMNNHYSDGTDVGKNADTYRKQFKALPENADIKMYWETADTRVALVLNHDELNAQNRYYYVHAEPK